MKSIFVTLKKPSCSSLTCGPDSMDLEMDPLLFGLVTDPSDTIWPSNAKPTFNGEKLVYSASLGAPDMTVTTINNEKTLLTKVNINLYVKS